MITDASESQVLQKVFQIEEETEWVSLDRSKSRLPQG